MYLTDDREKTVRDIIQQLEPDLFERVTSLSLFDFKQLVQAKVFNDTKMNDVSTTAKVSQRWRRSVAGLYLGTRSSPT